MPAPPAVLTDASGSRVALTIAGYEYDHADEDDYNWLVIGLAATDGEKHWTATDAALLPEEVARLIGWLRAVASGSATTTSLDFYEPMLAFEAEGNGATTYLTVTLAYSFRPPWLPQFEQCQIRLCPSLADVRTCATVLEDALARFPVRGPLGRPREGA